MKRFCFILIIAVLLAGTVSAQSQADRSSAENRTDRRSSESRTGRRSVPDSNTVTIDGTLKLERGFIAVASGDNVYYVPMLTRYIGFIEGLKEGARVSVEGYTFRNIIHPSKVTIDSKSYDFITGGPGRMGNGFGSGARNNFGSGRGGYCPGCTGYDRGRNGRGWDRDRRRGDK